MKWFKHDSDANRKVSIRKLKNKYGMEGFGLYWHLVELIAYEVDAKHLTFELSHDSELISIDTGIHFERVQEMIAFMVMLGLFENSSGTITCLKLAQRIDESTAKNEAFKKFQGSLSGISGKTPEGIGSDEEKLRLDKIRLEEIRLEEIRLEEIRREIEEEKKRLEKTRKEREEEEKAQAPLLPEYIDAKTWEAFGHMRKSIRKPLTPKAIELIIKKLDGFRLIGIDPNVSLENSILNSWQSVFEPTSKNKSSELTTHNIAAAQEFIAS